MYWGYCCYGYCCCGYCCYCYVGEFIDYVVEGVTYSDVNVQLACVYTCIQLYSQRPPGQSSHMLDHPQVTQKLVHDLLQLLEHTNHAALISSLVGQCSHILTPLSVWPHLFRGAGHEKRGEQLKWSLAHGQHPVYKLNARDHFNWSLAFSLYIGSCPCAQLPGPVHIARLGRVFFVVVYLA